MTHIQFKLFAFKIIDRNNTAFETVLATDRQTALLAIPNHTGKAIFQEIPASFKDVLKYKLAITHTINLGDRVSFYRNTHKCLIAGASLKDALILAVHSTTSPLLKGILTHVISEISKRGITLSDAFKMHSNYFDNYTIALIKASEASGKLWWAFAELSKEHEYKHIIQKKIRSGLFYPMMLMFLCIVAVFVISIFALPNIIDNFKQFGSAIPPLTAKFIAIIDFLKYYKWVLCGIFASCIAILCKTMKGEDQRVFFRVLHYIPLINNILLGTNLANGLKTVSTLMEAGVHVDVVYDYAKKVSNNPLLKNYFEGIYLKIKQGVAPEHAYYVESQKLGNLGKLVSAELQIAKFCGERDKILYRVADGIYADTAARAESMTKFIEPLMLIPISAFIGFLMIIVYLPTFDLMMNVLNN